VKKLTHNACYSKIPVMNEEIKAEVSKEDMLLMSSSDEDESENEDPL